MLSLRRSLVLCAALAFSVPSWAGEVITQPPAVQPANVPGDKARPDAFNVLPGFRVERIFNVPKDKFGSWVSITVDPKGRLITSDQERKGLYRITPPTVGGDEPTKVEQLDVKITA